MIRRALPEPRRDETVARAVDQPTGEAGGMLTNKEANNGL